MDLKNRFGIFQTFVLNLGRFLKIFGKSKKKRVEFLKIQGVFSKIPGRAKKKKKNRQILKKKPANFEDEEPAKPANLAVKSVETKKQDFQKKTQLRVMDY